MHTLASKLALKSKFSQNLKKFFPLFKKSTWNTCGVFLGKRCFQFFLKKLELQKTPTRIRTWRCSFQLRSIPSVENSGRVTVLNVVLNPFNVCNKNTRIVTFNILLLSLTLNTLIQKFQRKPGVFIHRLELVLTCCLVSVLEPACCSFAVQDRIIVFIVPIKMFQLSNFCFIIVIILKLIMMLIIELN